MASDTDRILHEIERVRLNTEKAMRLDIYLHAPEAGGERLARIETMLQTIIEKEIQDMAIGQDILDKITAQATTIDSIKALFDAWAADGTITSEQRAAIDAAFAANSSKLAAIEAALQPTAPPVP